MKVLVTYITFLVLFLNAQARSYFQRDDYTSTYEDDEQQVGFFYFNYFSLKRVVILQLAKNIRLLVILPVPAPL